MVTRLEILLSWLALPIYVWQGLGVRRKIIRQSPPPQPASISIKGKGRPLRILLIGDSSAAGVGVDRFAKSIAGLLPQLLADQTRRPVHLKPSGNNSATSADLRDYVVPHLARDTYDYVSLNIGINDAKNFHTRRRFCREFGSLIYALKARFPGATIIWSGVIDMIDVPALPTPLNKILSIRSRIISRNGIILCEERGALAPKSKWRTTRDNFSGDGFHASQKGYREWAEGIAEVILALENNQLPKP